MSPRVRPQTITLVIVLSDGTDGESSFAMPKKSSSTGWPGSRTRSGRCR